MMKRLLILLVAAMPLFIFAAKRTFYPGTIYFRNGESVDYTGIAIPGPASAAVTVSNDPKHKEREKVPTADILSIALWHENYPDKVGYLYPIQIARGKGTQTLICLLECSSSWGAVLQMGDYYAINNSDGELYGVVVGMNGAVPLVQHYLLKSGKEKAVLLFTNQSWTHRRSRAAQHFAENKEIADGIASGKLKTTDIAYILDAMAMSESATAASDSEGVYEEPINKDDTARNDVTPDRTTRKNTAYGIDNAYEMPNVVRISYTNFLSPNQLIEGVYMRSFSYAIGEIHIGGRWEQVPHVKYGDGPIDTPLDTIMQPKASFVLGVSLGGQLPIQLGKYYLIPRVTAGLMLSPFSLTSKNGNGMLFAVPLTAGVEFAIPIGSAYAFNIGIHYTYNFDFYDPEDYSMKLRWKGLNGLGASVAFCW